MAKALFHPINSWRHYRAVRQQLARLMRPTRVVRAHTWQLVRAGQG